MKTEEILQKSKSISDNLLMFLKSIDYYNYPDLSEIDGDEFVKSELITAFQFFDMAYARIQYINKPIVAEGLLSKQSNGRYALDEYEYNSGDTIEFLFYDDCIEKNIWARSRIEHNGDYYIYNYNFVSLDNLMVRRR